tara:strand:- start:229 stop:882 length:654 start_codon:yes stop_codon:yes gene_type:complete
MIRKFLRKLIFMLSRDLKNFTIENNLFDLKRLDYNYSIFNIYNKVKNVPGHILELGTGTGRNSILFSYLIKKNKKQEIVKYFGYDLFDNHEIFKIKDSNKNYEKIKELIKLYDLEKIAVIVKGDINKEIYNFEKLNFGFRDNKPLLSLIYIDCNNFETTLNALEHLKNYLSPGAYICTDEKKIGQEIHALKKFSEKYNLELKSGDYDSFTSTYCIWK